MSRDPLISEYAGDSQMQPLLQHYAAHLLVAQSELQESLDRCDAERILSIGHKLKGTGGGYGFPDITNVSAKLERTLRQTGSIQDDVRVLAKELVELCRRASAGIQLQHR